MTKYFKFFAAMIVVGFMTAGSVQTSDAGVPNEIQQLSQKENPSFDEICKAYNDYFDKLPENKRRGWKQFKRWEHHWKMRITDDRQFPSQKLLAEQFDAVRTFDNKSNRTLGSEWELVGPIKCPVIDEGGQSMGRVNVVRFTADDENIIWAGAAGGGAWKSTDAGLTWKTFPFTETMSLGVTDIAVSAQDKDLVYVATGDVDNAYTKRFFSSGLLRTTDGGTSWKKVAFDKDLEAGYAITRVLISPIDKNTVLAATKEGLFKSIDGGNTWSRKSTGAYFRDMEFSPENPSVIHAVTYRSNCAIYKSSDAGETWVKKRSVPGAARIALAVTPANTEYVYALAATQCFHSLLKSTDEGDSWEVVSNINDDVNILGRAEGINDDKYEGQGTYDLCIAVSPEDEDIVFTGGINLWRSDDGGEEFSRISKWISYQDNYSPYAHADHHDLMFRDNSNELYTANDGGLAKSVNMGDSWIDLTDGLSITQVYDMSVSQTENVSIIIGAQDNGTHLSSDEENWNNVYGGDGMSCMISPENPNIVFASLYYGQILRSKNGGKKQSDFSKSCDTKLTQEKGPWITPMTFDDNNSQTIYLGYNNVWRSTNNGLYNSWEKVSDWGTPGSENTITAIDVAPSDSKTIWAANFKELHVTHDNCNTWDLIATTAGNISSIAVDPKNPNRCWVSMSDFTSDEKVLCFEGKNEINISGNLPNVPVNTIIYQNDSPDRIYVGTDVGVYYTDNNSPMWQKLGNGLPNVVVNDLEIHKLSSKLYIGTFGRGVWKTDLVKCNIEQPKVTVTGALELCEGDSVKLEAQDGFSKYEWTTGETSRTIYAKETGSYGVRVSDGSGCTSGSKVVSLSVYSVPSLKITPKGEFPVCVGDSVKLTASFGFADYKWSNGDEGRTIWAYQPGEISLKATTNKGCEVEFAIDVPILPLPEKPTVERKPGNIITSSEAETYQWYKDKKKIEGAIYRNYQLPVGNAVYNVEIQCGVMSDDFVGVEDETPMGTQLLTVSPNPAIDHAVINIRTIVPASYTLDVTNVTGENVFSIEGMTDGSITTQNIDLQDLPAAVYFVTLRYGTVSKTIKLIKK